MGRDGLKIILLHPQVPTRTTFEKLGRSHLPPLGALYIAAALSRAGHQTAVHDLNLAHDLPALLDEVVRARPQLVGIGTLAPAFSNVAALARTLRQRLPPSTLLVAGGPDATTRPGRYLELSCFDAVLVGEAERTFVDLCDARPDIPVMPGVLTSDSGHFDLPAPVVPNEAPFPARHLVPLKQYRGGPAYKRSRHSTSIFTHRGCPYNCSFCEKGVHTGPMRFRSADSIFEEVRRIRQDHGIHDIRFIDDVFMADLEILDDFLELVLRRGERFSWMCTGRVDLMEEQVLRKMRRAGCYRLEIGVESGSERVLKMINKRITTNDARQALQMVRRVGLEAIANFILGFPTETEAEIMQTIEFSLELDPDWAIFFDYYPLQGSRMARRYSLNWEADQSRYNRPDEIFNVSPQRLDELVSQAYRRFYLHPSQVARKLASLRSGWIMMELARMALAFSRQNLQ